ncbi:MAG: alpha/beta fold hydrolase [Bacilli bacterium]|nr:alpha/beta fold hydrolase [Bacilli bacterium]
MRFRKAVLIIHGFAGGTYDQEFLANYLELDRLLDVYTFTLPGHDSYTRAKVTKEDWINSAEDHLKMLIKNGYNKIYVIGHSMGGVIATYVASKHKEVKKLVLVAPAFKFLSFSDGTVNVIEIIKQAPELIKTYNSDEILSRILKLPIRTVSEFIELVKQYHDSTSDIRIPTLIIQGLNDSIVPVDSSKYVYDTIKSKKKKILYFENTTHDVFRGNTKETISMEIKKFLR